MMTTHEVQTLLTIGENSVIEFKRAGDGPKWDTYESICAFLNRNGGDVLLLGSDDCIGGPLDDDYSPEKGHLQKRQTIQAGVQQTRQQRGFIEHTLPNAKRSKFQKYRLTRRGHAVVENVLRSRKEVNQ